MRSAEMVAREYSPRCLPSGWSHLTGGRQVVRENGTVLSVYGGFGMRVWVQLQRVETPSSQGWLVHVGVEKKSALTVDDTRAVMLGLFRHSKWSREVRTMWHDVEAAQTWAKRLEVGQQGFFAFASELIPLDFSDLPGIR